MNPISSKDASDDIVLEPKFLECRMFLSQLQSYSKHKKAKMSYTPSSDSLSVSHLPRSVSGGQPSTSTTSGNGCGEGTSKRLSTSHGERFCSPRSAVQPPETAEEAYKRELQESWKAEPSAAQSSRSTVLSPLRRPESVSSRKQTPSYHENWKRKREKFALAEKQKPADYQWMLFLELLKRQPNTMEFVYLQPPKVSKTPEFDPFELEVVTYGQIDSPYYYTVSSQGVTLFRDGDAEFTPLDQWERGYRSYKCIINLNVFRQYKYWKNWKVWKHHVRRKKRKISTELLLKLLFTCNVIFAAVLLQIRAMCVDLWTVRFLQLDMGEVYTLERFMTVQESRRKENAKILLELTNKAVEALRESCIRALSKLEEDLLGRREDEPQNEMMKEVTEKEDGKEKSNRNKIAGAAARWKAQKERDSEEKESQERYTYLIAAAKRSEQVRLQNCIRLTDYLISDALREVLSSTFRDLLHRVAHKPQPPPEARQSVTPAPAAEVARTPAPGEKETDKEKDKEKEEEEEKKRASKRGSSSRQSTIEKRGSTLLMKNDEGKKPERLQVFEVDLAMIDDHLVLVPSFSDFERNIEIWIKGIMDVVRSLRRLLYHTVLDGVVDNGDSGIENLATYLDLIGEAQFGGLIASIKVSISLAYKDADKNKGTFKPYVDTAIKSKFISQQSMRDEIKAGTRDLQVFKTDIIRYRTEIKEIEAAPNSADIGILHINYVTLKGTLLPFPREALQNIYQLVPKLANEHYEVFINEIHMSEKKMAVKPTTVEEFVDIANFAEVFHCKLDKFEAEFDLIHDHYALMKDHNIPIPDLEYASYLMMNNDFTSCKEAMEIVEETKNENIKRFSSALAVEVETLRKDVITIREAAQNPMTLNPDIDQEVILEYMSKLNQDVISQKAKAQRIVMYQKLFQVDESRFDDLMQAAEEVDLRYSLWLGLKELAEKSGAWIATHFESLDTQEVEEVVNKYAKLTVKLERGMVPNPVVQKLRKQVDDLRLSVPVMQNMRNKCLRDRHWKKIELEISHKIERNAQFTLGKLIEYNVMEYKAQIANISNEATQEAALEELMEGVKQKWSTIEFVVKQYKEFKDVYVLGGVDDVLAALEDAMVTMNTVTSSRYVAGIKNEVDKMENQLKHFGKTLDQWCECQKQWMYLESIFSAPDIQRQLPNESKAFFAVDKQFKDIMKRTHDRANALQAGTSPGWLETFQKSNETLEKIQKNLEDYLETKRMAFPRFYFLSNDELLEILAQTRNVQAVQPHMSKCFDKGWYPRSSGV